MKILKNWFKLQEQKSKLDLISELLICGTVEENATLFEKVKVNFHYQMELKKQELENDYKIISNIK